MAPNGNKRDTAPNPPDGATYSLDIPTKHGFIWGSIVIVGGLGVAAFVYAHYDKGYEAYFVKLADTLIQGAVVGIGFAILKTIIEAIKIRPN